MKRNFPSLDKRCFDIFIILNADAKALAVIISNLFSVISFGVMASSRIFALVSCRVRIVFLIK